MSKEERSGRKGAVAGPPGPATIGDRGRICDSSQQFTAGLAGHIALPTLSSSTENVGLSFERMEDYFELTETPPQKKLPLLKFYLDDTLRRVLPALNVSSSDCFNIVVHAVFIDSNSRTDYLTEKALLAVFIDSNSRTDYLTEKAYNE
ncbi:hypothetical protein M513_12330 [Trichuris suis]|uniref:Uncharacterized protein n=1 Tax=Trichuris suis TaxID=68888 RepID=A0A085LPA6_9BILA|nr:hypothetical protein M513_12330 [Trichuris suis]